MDLPWSRLEGLLDDVGVGGVNHYGALDLAGYEVEEGGDVGQFVPVGVLKANVQDVGAVADLAAAHLGGLLELALTDEAAEAPAAENVGALAHDGGAGVVVHDQGFDAGDAGLLQP